MRGRDREWWITEAEEIRNGIASKGPLQVNIETEPLIAETERFLRAALAAERAGRVRWDRHLSTWVRVRIGFGNTRPFREGSSDLEGLDCAVPGTLRQITVVVDRPG